MRTKNMHKFKHMKTYITSNYNKIMIVMLYKANVKLKSTMCTKFTPNKAIQLYHIGIIRHILFKH